MGMVIHIASKDKIITSISIVDEAGEVILVKSLNDILSTKEIEED
jgi:hypothetical protein